MKIIFSLLFMLIGLAGYSQSTLPLRADTVLVEKTGGSGELKIKNSTRDSLGLLVNIGGGRTRFMRVRQITDTSFVIPNGAGGDTIRIESGGGGTWGSITGTLSDQTDLYDSLLARFRQNGNSFGDSARLGTNDNNPILFKTNNISHGIFTTSGRFGIKNISPQQDLDLTGTFGLSTMGYPAVLNDGAPAVAYIVHAGGNYGLNITRASNDAGAANLSFYKTRSGDASVSNPLQKNDLIGRTTYQGVDASSVIRATADHGVIVDTINTTNIGGHYYWNLHNLAGASIEKMRLDYNGLLTVTGKGLYTDTLTATTMGTPDSSDRVASTAWVKRQGYGSGGGGGGGTSDSLDIDVFLIGGQSNAVGHISGANPYTDSSGNLLQYYLGNISFANDPVGPSSGVSAWPTFGIRYHQITGRRILFVPMGVNSSAQAVNGETVGDNWDTTGTLFQKAVDTTRKAISDLRTAGYRPVFKGVLWSQGEQDALRINSGDETQQEYLDALLKMARRFRDSLGRMPVYMFKTGYDSFSIAPFRTIRELQDTAVSRDTLIRVVFNAAPDFIPRGLMGDQIHYGVGGYNEMGFVGAEGVASFAYYSGWHVRSKDVYYNTGNVVIGADSAAQGNGLLNVRSQGTNGGAVFGTAHATAAPFLSLQKSRGDLRNPGSLVSGNIIGQLNYDGYDGTGYATGFNTSVSLRGTSNGTWSSTSHPGYLSVLTTNSGSTVPTERVRFHPDGNVSIGTFPVPAQSLLLLAAGTTSRAPLQLTTGTDHSTPANGMFFYNSASFRLAFVPNTSIGVRRVALTTDAAPTAGQIPIGDGNVFANATLTQGTGITITNGAGSVTVAVNGSGAFPVQQYTPTLTGLSNVTGISTSDLYYQRVGMRVHVWGTIGIDPTSTSTLTEVAMSLPVASTIANTGVCSGSGYSDTIAQGIAIKGDSVNDRAIVSFLCGADASSVNYYFNFSYEVTPP